MSAPLTQVAIFGGVYSNHLALRAAIDDARARGAQAMYCLGDIGAFGPNPDKTFPLLLDAGVRVMQGNYDHSIGNDLPDCQCGYTDPADNHYARLSYQYTYRKTSGRWRPWLKGLPTQLRFEISAGSDPHPDTRKALRVLCCHGSPRKTNEFLWESTTPTHLLERFCDDFAADVIVATHTGLPWTRRLSNGRLFVNCGVLGRPANDGTTSVSYAMLDARRLPGDAAQHVRVEYDHERLAAEMRDEHLPEPFVETILTGWWTTCLEILPARERWRGRH